VNLKSGWTRVVLDETISADGKRQYTAHMDAPEDGRYVAYLIDVKYDVRPPVDVQGIPLDLPGRLEFTTEVSIFPNTYPYEDCTGSGCRGTLL
jgi:hypothetical protein